MTQLFSASPPKDDETKLDILYSKMVQLKKDSIGARAQNILGNKLLKLTKNAIVSICIICSRLTGVSCPRPCQRKIDNAFFYLNLNFELFEPILSSVRTERLIDQNGGNVIGFRYHIGTESYDAGPNGRINNLFGKKRAKKTNVSEECRKLEQEIQRIEGNVNHMSSPETNNDHFQEDSFDLFEDAGDDFPSFF